MFAHAGKLHGVFTAAIPNEINIMRIKLLFKKTETSQEDIRALIDMSISLNVSINHLVNFADVRCAGEMDRLAA